MLGFPRNFGLTELSPSPSLRRTPCMQDSSVEGIKSTTDSGKKVWGKCPPMNGGEDGRG